MSFENRVTFFKEVAASAIRRILLIVSIGLVWTSLSKRAEATPFPVITVMSGPNTMMSDGSTNMLMLTNFALTGGGSFTGTVTETVTSTSDIINYLGTFGTSSGAASMTISNMYTFPAESGILATDFSSKLTAPANDTINGREFFQTTATATTYSGRKPVTAEMDYSGSMFVGAPIPTTGLLFTGQDRSAGPYSFGPGTLTGTVSYNTSGADRSFSSSGEFIAAVPEPATWLLIGCGLIFIVFRCRVLRCRTGT